MEENWNMKMKNNKPLNIFWKQSENKSSENGDEKKKLDKENNATHALLVLLDKDKKFINKILRKSNIPELKKINKAKIFFQCSDKEYKKETKQKETKIIFSITSELNKDPGDKDGGYSHEIYKHIADGLMLTEDVAILIEAKFSGKENKKQIKRYNREFFGGKGEVVHIQWEKIYSLSKKVCGKRNKESVQRYLHEQFEEYLEANDMAGFQGIPFDVDKKDKDNNNDVYNYDTAKRVLKNLIKKIAENERFMKEMDLNHNSKREKISDNLDRVWGLISFNNPNQKTNIKKASHTSWPHCTFMISNSAAEAMITFPNGMIKKKTILDKLRGHDHKDFLQRLKESLKAIKKNLGKKGYQPVIKLLQRHYINTNDKFPAVDGQIVFDLRTSLGGEDYDKGTKIYKQEEWSEAVYALLSNKESNMQFQIGVIFHYKYYKKLKKENADESFIKALEALKPFVDSVIEPNKNTK